MRNVRLRLDRLKWDATYDETDTILGQMGEWPLAESYHVIDGRICPTGPRIKERSFPARSPLLDNGLASSFAQLGARGKPSKERILGWVRQRGLLTRKDDERPAMQDLDDGGINQASVSLEAFRREVERARGLLTLYVQLLGQDAKTILQRIEQPQSLVDQELASHFALISDSELQSALSQLEAFQSGALLAVVYDADDVPHSLLNDAMVLYDADQVLCALLNDAIGQVKLQALPSFRAHEEQPRRYQPWRSWYCPDLLSAIYLQIYLLVTGSVPMRICKNLNCRTPFPVTRKDRWVCKPGCRSSARGS